MENNTGDLFKRHNLIVSRETIEKLEIYEKLLLKWQKAINLVGPSTLKDAPTRHFLDSAQLITHIDDPAAILVDMGSGAGFPGMVLAILGMRNVHLIESDVRKATFLHTVSRETNTAVTIHEKRVEDCRIEGVDIVTARALSSLRELLDLMAPFVGRRGVTGLFLKGAQYQVEIEDAKKSWEFTAETFPSLTDPAGRVVKVSHLISKRCGT